MARFLLPLILVGVSIGLFVVYTNPTYQGPEGIKALSARAASFDEALQKSNDLRKAREALRARYNTITAEENSKLLAMLPDNVDNIRLAIDINNIAAQNNLAVKNLSVGDTKAGASARSATAVGASGSPIGMVDLSFGVSADYATFEKFLNDLERSLRIIDVEGITFVQTLTGVNEYNITIRTYWLH